MSPGQVLPIGPSCVGGGLAPTVALDTLARVPYPDINLMLDDAFPAGTSNYWKSAFLRDVTPDAIGVLVDAFATCPSPLTSIVIAHYHGATSRVSSTATAFPHRGPGYSLVILTQWADPEDTNAVNRALGITRG